MTSQVALLFESGSQKDWNPDGLEVATNDVAEAPPALQEAKGTGNSKDRKYGSKASRERSAGEAVLADYLSRLTHLPLLTGEQEREMARNFHGAEEEAWVALLQDTQVIQMLCDHPCQSWSRFRDLECVQRMNRRLKRADKGGSELGPRSVKAQMKDAVSMAKVLRDIDEEQALITEVIKMLSQIEITPKPGETATQRHQRALKEQRQRRKILKQAVMSHKKAMGIRNRFVKCNLRLVVSVARRFHHHQMPLIDLIQEGNLGLLKSIHCFDPARGFRFSTYAHWWIRQSIERAIMNKGTQVRLPVHIFDSRRELNKLMIQLRQVKGCEPTNEELASAMGVKPAKVNELKSLVPREPASLEDRVNKDDRTLKETLADPEQKVPEELVAEKEMSRKIRSVLFKLAPMERDIIARRFGFTYESETLEEIGQSYNLSRERVRQIQVQGLKKLQRLCVQKLWPRQSYITPGF
jgi:RNA polymerase primary sigma factor